jgi:hypothetical protein
VDARKEKIDDDSAWEMLRKYDSVIIGRGKKFSEFEPVEDNRETILKAAMGRSGNLRAPALGLKEKIVIGFNEDMYDRFVRNGG